MQGGTHTVGDGMRRHLVTLERERENLEQSMRLCQRLTACQERLGELDAGAVLAEMESLEQSGTTFQNKQRQDIRVRYVAPVVITLLTVALMTALAALIIWASLLDPLDAPPLLLMLVLAAIPLLVAGGTVLALVQRIREIGKGEEDVAKQF